MTEAAFFKIDLSRTFGKLPKLKNPYIAIHMSIFYWWVRALEPNNFQLGSWPIAFSSKIYLLRFITANFSVLSRGKIDKLIKGSFNNYVDNILPFFGPPPSLRGQGGKNGHFWSLPHLFHVVNEWPPKGLCFSKKLILLGGWILSEDQNCN